MPNSMLDLDTNFPNLSGEQSTDAKLAAVQNYLYMLVEQLRYSLRNLDLTNWNSSALAGFTGSITEPIYGRIEDAEGRMNQFQADAEGLRSRLSDAEGNITQLQADAEGLSGRISDAEGNIHALELDAEGMRGRISDAEGNITSLSARADGIETRVGNAEGDISSLSQSAEKITSRVSDAEGRLSVVEQKADSVTTTVGELGGSFTQLQQTVNGFTFTDEQGKVWIDNGSLQLTGTITWADLNSSVQNSINNAGISEATARSIANSVASTVITSTLVASPTIIGANIYGSRIWAGDSQDSYMTLDEDGLWLYLRGIAEPKIKLGLMSAYPYIQLGAGTGTGMTDTFMLYKEIGKMRLLYTGSSGDREITFDNSGIHIYGPLDLSQATVTGFTPKFT